jgi:hypothetical protein
MHAMQSGSLNATTSRRCVTWRHGKSTGKMAYTGSCDRSCSRVDGTHQAGNGITMMDRRLHAHIHTVHDNLYARSPFNPGN